MAEYQKKVDGMKHVKGNLYYPKSARSYSSTMHRHRRELITESDFIDLIDKSKSFVKKADGIVYSTGSSNRSYTTSFDEHQMLDHLINREWKRWGNLYRINHELDHLLFYHWYERKYKINVFNENVLVNLSLVDVMSWFEKFSKEELEKNIGNKLAQHMRSNRFKDFTIYYEYYYDFFPNIESFSFEQFKRKDFIVYLLELFPEVVQIINNSNSLWRFTEEELQELEGESPGSFVKYAHHRENTYNPVSFTKFKLPSFLPTKKGEKNYEYYKIDSTKCHTPLFKVERQRTREIENFLRQERGVPKIGEGWVSETMLFYNIKKEIPDFQIIHHGHPDWLGRQHLDVYIPDLNIAIEYQGTQHQKPIEYFGGEEAFKRGQERDARKKRLCEENGCKLFYVYPEDDTKKFIKELKKYIKKAEKKS